jgi:hypothetical protein
MNRAFDHNGVTVSASKPQKELRTVKKTIFIDSADRDVLKYPAGGDFVVYLPRVYKNIVSIRLSAAEFPSIDRSFTHTYGTAVASGESPLYGSSKGGGDDVSSVSSRYFLIDIEGLNKTDETAIDADRSSFVDSTFAVIPVPANSGYVQYNDHSAQDNISYYTPPIENLDRLHIRTRLHSQQGNKGFIYWIKSTQDPSYLTFSLTLEIEYIDNVFDSFSSFETRINNRA